MEVPGTGNIWIRDWMPIRCGDRFVKFRTKADTTKYPFLEVPRGCWHNIARERPGEIREGRWVPPMIVPPDESDIILDGGNVVRSPDGKRVLMTAMALHDNINVQCGKAGFEKLLDAEIVWLPIEPGDDLGHSDGIASWIDNDTVFVNDYRSMRDRECSCYSSALRRVLFDNGIECVPFPYAYDECRDLSEQRFRQEFPEADDFNPAWGYYVNFAKWTGSNHTVVCYPIFHHAKDRQCEDALLDAFPGCQCVGLDCSRLAMEGGLSHCISWER